MVSRLSDAMKLAMARNIAKSHNYYIVEIKERDRERTIKTKWILYRSNGEGMRGSLVGKRSSCDGILALTNQATGHV